MTLATAHDAPRAAPAAPRPAAGWPATGWLGAAPAVWDAPPGWGAPARARDEGLGLREIGAVLRARLPSILLILLASLGLAVAYVALKAPTYRATTSLLVDPRAGAPGEGPRLTAADAGVVESQVKLVTAPSALRRVVEAQRLVDDPEFGPGPPGPRRRLLDALGLGAPETPPSAAPGLSPAARRALGALADRVVVKRSERTFVLDVEVSARDPDKAARLADAVADAFLEDQAEARALANRADGRWLRARLAEAEGRIREAEARAEGYRREERLPAVEGRPLTERQLGDASDELSAVRVRAAEARARLDTARRLAAQGAAGAAEAVRSGLVERLRLTYADALRAFEAAGSTLGPRHPQFLEAAKALESARRQVALELGRVVEGLRFESASLDAAEAAARARVEAGRGAGADAGARALRLRELEREVEGARAVYDRLLRASGAAAQDAIDQPPARVIAPALPPLRPSAPSAPAALLLALVGGLGLGVGRALLLGAPGGAPVGPTALGPPALPAPAWTAAARGTAAFAPPAPFAPAVAPPPAARAPAPPGVVEEFAVLLPRSGDAPAFERAVAALAERLAPDAAGLRTLLITSAEAGCGKSTLAAALARALGAAGARVLVVDANPANPALTRAALAARATLAARAGPRGAAPRAGLVALRGAWRDVLPLAPGPGGATAAEGAPPGPWLLPLPAAAARGLAPPAGAAPRALFRADDLAASFDVVLVDGPALGRDGAAEGFLDAADRALFVAPLAPGEGRTSGEGEAHAVVVAARPAGVAGPA